MVSKVTPQQNLAAALTNNHTASGLHRFLPKLKMHTRSADALALSTGQGGGPASFRNSASSFFIGVLRKPPAMAQLVTAKELLGKETEKIINIPELAVNFDILNELTAERACGNSFDSRDELTAERACLAQSLQARELDESFSGSA